MSTRLVGIGRVVRGEVVVLASPDWDNAGMEAGRLLRLYQHPLSRCTSDSQRQGWMAEDARFQQLPKSR